MPGFPQRIVCLATETVETLYLLGKERRIAGAGKRPRVYFEEWNEFRICGMRRVSKLIDIAGGASGQSECLNYATIFNFTSCRTRRSAVYSHIPLSNRTLGVTDRSDTAYYFRCAQ